ncbi:MAG: hypothetical protein IJM92_10440 [Fibrobacter sp.]|uniref:ribonuclease domain-containing protein n=1 Tax=Fibrobacter sp. TaxID=35828 RepID=UPI0025C6FCD6|nr:ribonuclease domain-containing protein [Fibrobacter sp.]MBQ3715182.1 hypothetical protein [Fibrobacter sp.]MBQ7080053.1 hypothetical protein [Fibrobacter sp.]
MNRTFFKLFLAVFTAVFFAACSTPTIPNDDDSYGLESSSSKEKSSSSKKLSSSSKAKSSSSKISSSSSSKVTESSSSKAKSSSSKVSSSSSSSEKKLSSSISLLSIYEAVEESGLYTTKDSVAAYLCKFDKLPANYVGKNEGKKLYESETGNTFSKWNFNPWTTIGVMIGGDNFDNYASHPNNYHATLPEGSYHEADVDYSGKNRGTKRLVYQSDCVIYYTADHYETFKKLEIR